MRPGRESSRARSFEKSRADFQTALTGLKGRHDSLRGVGHGAQPYAGGVEDCVPTASAPNAVALRTSSSGEACSSPACQHASRRSATASRLLAAFRFNGQQVLVVVKEGRTEKGKWARNGYRVLPISRLRIYDSPEHAGESGSANDTARVFALPISRRPIDFGSVGDQAIPKLRHYLVNIRLHLRLTTNGGAR